MTAPALSIIMPAYNREETILVATQSVLDQSFGDFELIVVDDGSTDNTVGVLEGITDPRLKILPQDQNRGVSAARNIGIRAATAPWIAFQDSDDAWMPDKLEAQMARIAEMGPNCIGAYCGMAVIRTPDRALAKGARTHLRYMPPDYVTEPEGDIRKWLAYVNLISTQTLIARADILDQLGGFDEELPALVDWDLVLRMAPLGVFGFVDRPLVHQYFSDNSITKSQKKRTRAHAHVLTKNHALFAPYKANLAYNYRALSGNYRQTGQPAEALTWMKRAIAMEPWRLKNYALAVLLILRGRRSKG